MPRKIAVIKENITCVTQKITNDSFMIYASTAWSQPEIYLGTKIIYYKDYCTRSIENSHFYIISTLLDPRLETLAQEASPEIENKYIYDNDIFTSTTSATQKTFIPRYIPLRTKQFFYLSSFLRHLIGFK